MWGHISDFELSSDFTTVVFIKDFYSMSIQSIGIIGSGAMGRGIAQLFAQSGCTIVLHDTQAPALLAAEQYLAKTFDTLVAKGKLQADQAKQIIARVSTTPELAGLAQCDLVIEAIVENLAVKQTVFKALEALLKPSAIMVSNTSSLSITAIASACQQPQRVAGLHFFNPVPLMKVVEVIRGVKTDPAVVTQLMQLVALTGHTAVQCADFPGFIVNHAGRAYGTEALRLLGEGVGHFNQASDNLAYQTIDQVLREQVLFAPIAGANAATNALGQGFKLGPFELLDLTALDVSHPVMESIFNQFYQEPRFRPSAITAQRLAAGLLGRKTEQGFYSYKDGALQKPIDTRTANVDGSKNNAAKQQPIIHVWVGPGLQRAGVIELLSQLGASVENTSTPSQDSLIVLLPEGKDCTTEAIECQVAPERSISLDTLFSFGFKACKRRVIMTNPATDLDLAHRAAQLFAADGCEVSVLQDSPGFIAPRVIAMIVAVASEIAQQGIASPQDIDNAVRLGLGYPLGPLSMGNQLGPQRILGLLEDMYSVTKDPRYRPGLWLRRRAQLNMSLLAA
jgi:3-hydroxybutyryl-CoA dehydrogenase